MDFRVSPTGERVARRLLLDLPVIICENPELNWSKLND